MYNHYVPVIICSQKMLKTKQLGNLLPSNSTSNLKSKKPSGQSAIKAFLDKGLPGKNGKLDMNISAVANKYAAARSFASSSVVVLSSFFL